MRILLCPDSYKGCLSAKRVAAAMRRGLTRAGAHAIDECPISDGGEGFTHGIAHALGAQTESIRATASNDQQIDIPWCSSVQDGVRTGFFTVADVVGLNFVPAAKRDPGALTTRGVGEVLIALRDAGCERIVVGLGGSGTVDGGVGMAAALGFRLLDAQGKPVKPIGNNLHTIARIEPPNAHPLGGLDIIAARDVNNPLTGDRGAARVFGPQKGATPDQVTALDAGLTNLAAKCAQAGILDDANLPGGGVLGGGSAGGLGFGLVAFADARLVPGAEVVIDALDLRKRIPEFDLVITGEGRLDGQSRSGKAAWAIGMLAQELGVP